MNNSINYKAVQIKKLQACGYNDEDIKVLLNAETMPEELARDFLKNYIHYKNINKSKIEKLNDLISEIYSKTKDEDIKHKIDITMSIL